jgi:hypothetical protein
MRKKPAKRESDKATRARVQKEMAKPRMAKSAREREINLTSARLVPEKL